MIKLLRRHYIINVLTSLVGKSIGEFILNMGACQRNYVIGTVCFWTSHLFLVLILLCFLGIMSNSSLYSDMPANTFPAMMLCQWTDSWQWNQLTVCLANCVSSWLCVHLNVCPNWLCVHLTVCPADCVSILLCVYPTVCISDCVSIWLCVRLTICPADRLCVEPSETMRQNKPFLLKLFSRVPCHDDEKQLICLTWLKT